jgi:hypothetical protein
MLHFLDRGWIPHDDGTLAHSAERVLAGELPHRDFVEGYTGLLTYLNAFAFKVFGVNLLALRYALFVASVVWVAVFYRAASRMLPTVSAGVVTLIAVFWSVPNYPAAMPSWYNLFLATGGLAALFEYIDSGKQRWLIIAGFLGGLSVLMKTHGMLFVAAGLLFLLYHESQPVAQADNNGRSASALQIVPGTILVCALLALLAIGLSRASWLDVYQFAIPGFAMVAIVARKFLRERSRTNAWLIVRAAIPYLLGAAIPVVAFVAYYAAADALPELVRDLFLLPARSHAGASLPPPIPLALIPLALIAFIAVEFNKAPKAVLVFQDALAVAFVAVLLVPKTALWFEPLVWMSLAETTPVFILLLAILIDRSDRRNPDPMVRSRYVLVGCVAAFCSLVQYPFGAPVYFTYSFPLLLLAIVAVVQAMPPFRPRAIEGIACVCLVFGALYISPMKLPGLLGPVARDDNAVLDLPRAGIRIAREDAENYPIAVQLLQSHSPSGVIYAGPDAPDLYFLTALRNPTPAVFDYQVPDSLFHQDLVQRLDSLGVNAVAIRRRVVHSPPLEPEIQAALAKKFPFEREVGRFTIRWR